MRDWILPAVPLTRRSTGEWELLDEWVCDVSLPVTGPLRIRIPRGFRFDLASVPRLFWRVIAPFELGLRAALAHDWLYRHGGLVLTSGVRLSRVESDLLFRLIVEWEDGRRIAVMRAVERSLRGRARIHARVRRWLLERWLPTRRWAAYYAVRLGGRWAWRD